MPDLNEAKKPVQPGTEFPNGDPVPIEDDDEIDALWAEAVVGETYDGVT